MENKKTTPATQQPLTQQHFMAHHVHPDQVYSQQQHSQVTHLSASQTGQIQPNGVMHQLLQSQYHSNMNARSPLLENRHELYGTAHCHDHTGGHGSQPNDNYKYLQPPRADRSVNHQPPQHVPEGYNVNHQPPQHVPEGYNVNHQPPQHVPEGYNVNHQPPQHVPEGYNAEVYKDYLKRNPPKDANQIYQNHQPAYAPNVNQCGPKPYLPYSSRIGPQSNTELLRRQYNEIQQMKLQQQLHYQNQAQMHQQQKFAERQMLLQQIHGVQPPPNLQNSIYSDDSYRDLDRYSSKNDFKEYSSPDIQKDIAMYAKDNEYREYEKQNRQYQEAQWLQQSREDCRELQQPPRRPDADKGKSQSPPSNYNHQSKKNSPGAVSPMKSSESSTPSIKSPSSDSRRSSGGHQALRSPVAQRVPSAPVTLSGVLYKQGSDGLKVWRKRWFVLSEYCLFYYKSQDEEKLLGSVLLPSYKVSACTAEDKVLRKFAFKLEHANMRTYILAAPDQEAMVKWVRALTMAALMQSPTEQQPRHGERAAARTEDADEVPAYANAPPKPRRCTEGRGSPSPDAYDPNYDLLKKPASHYSVSTSHARHQDNTNHPGSPHYHPSSPHHHPGSHHQEPTYTLSPQSPPSQYQPPRHQTRRAYDSQHLSLPLTNTVTDRLENEPNTLPSHKGNPQSPYFDRNRSQQHSLPANTEQVYDVQRNPFLQDMIPQTENQSKENELQNKNPHLSPEPVYNESNSEGRMNSKQNEDMNAYNRDIYGELGSRITRSGGAINERLIAERRTPDAYGRSTAMSSYRGEVGDYEDVYGQYAAENEYGKTYSKSPIQSRAAGAVRAPSQQQEEYPVVSEQSKIFSGPAVLRRKKQQSSGIQPPMPRPHSADFLEYESKAEMMDKNAPSRSACDPPAQPQRPKSSLDINSYYDPSSDRYYSEESYAEKMRQSAQYLQQGLAPRNMDIPLAKYASGLAKKQLSTAYSQITNNNYEAEFSNRDDISYDSKCADIKGLNSNWTLKEKETQKDYLSRSGSVMSDGSNISGYVKENNRYDQGVEGFMRSASARLPAAVPDKDGEKKIQQREESMKRLLEWKQRMLQSPLTRKSTPATISLARSLNQSRQSSRSDQFKAKTQSNASYNSYSSDDEEETSDTELQKARDTQAGRSRKCNQTTPIIVPSVTPQTPCSTHNNGSQKNIKEDENKSEISETTYQNILCTASTPAINFEDTIVNDISRSAGTTLIITSSTETKVEDGYETHDSEAESETQIEYTDNDLDEVLFESDGEVQFSDIKEIVNQDEKRSDIQEGPLVKPSTPVLALGENHYLPMSPRKMSANEPPHIAIFENLSIFDKSMLQAYEDNPYVEMNLGNEEDMQTYEIVCVNNGKDEPVYMELNIVTSNEHGSSGITGTKLLDTASNFTDTDHQMLKRVIKSEKPGNEKSDCSDADDEPSKDMSLDSPFNRFSISDTFRPASYYLNGSNNELDIQDSLDSEILSSPPVPSSSPPCDELSNDALSKYVLEKLDKSDISQDNSILKMLTCENQQMNTVKRKTTSLMIYGSRTSIHDTLSRGEKIRNSRVSQMNNREKMNENSSSNLNCSLLDHYNFSSSIETDSLRSYSADRGSSRLSVESDVSSKFDIAPSNISSEVTSLNESELAVNFRHPVVYRDIEMMIKRRPVSDDSIFELVNAPMPSHYEITSNIDLDQYLDKLQSGMSNSYENDHSNNSLPGTSNSKDNMVQAALQTHIRCSSTPINHCSKLHSSCSKNSLGAQFRHINEQSSNYIGSQNSCSSSGITKSPISYYCKNYDEERFLSKNLNNGVLPEKVKEFENEKISLKTGNETQGSSTSTGFHSRESSTEHSAPYYYSDLSSQEHINVLSTSHYLKNTNLHRKLNNQRRRGPLHKKNEISHIQNPIRNNQLLLSEQSFELASSARSVSVEFLSAADKDPEIDMKNIYESTGGKNSKIPESMSLISGLGCKRNSTSNSNDHIVTDVMNTSSLIKLSSTSMSSHCSGNSSNTVYYDAEADAAAYENVICHGEKHWEEDVLWRDNLRRVSHRHARSMDDLDLMPAETSVSNRMNIEACRINSIKRVKNGSTKKDCINKISRNVTYVNCDIQGRLLRCRENKSHNKFYKEDLKSNENDVYVSLAEDAEIGLEKTDEGVYEQLAIECSYKENTIKTDHNYHAEERNKRKFEIDREKLRQWDLMSSGLMRGRAGRVWGTGAGVGVGEAACSAATGTDSASNEASMTMSGNNKESGINSNSSNQNSTLSRKAYLGSNTSIGRNSRDANIPVRAVSPRVRWAEDKPANDYYGSQQMSTSQQNLSALIATEDAWALNKSSTRATQQPIRAVSPRVRRNTETDDMQRRAQQSNQVEQLGEIPTAGELLGRTHEELVLLLIQLRRRHAATHRAIEQCCVQINSIEDCPSSVKVGEREENLQKLENLKMQLMELEHQYEKSKPLVQLVDNMVKLGSLYNRPGSTIERLERNQRLRQKVLAEHSFEQQRWLDSVAAGKVLETEAARARVAELWTLEQELADEAAILQGLKTDKDAIDNLLSDVRSKFDSAHRTDLTADIPYTGHRAPPNNAGGSLEVELARVQEQLAHNSKKLEQTVADNARLERELRQLRRALHARRTARPAHAPAHTPAHATAMLEGEVSRVQQLVVALQRQRQELSRAVRHLTQQSHALQTTHDAMPGKRRPVTCWQETNLDAGHSTDCGPSDCECEALLPPGARAPLYVDTRGPGARGAPPLYVDTRGAPPLDADDVQRAGLGNLSNAEKQEIKTVRIVKRESERRHRDRERCLQPAEWAAGGAAGLDQFLQEQLVQSAPRGRPDASHLHPDMELSPKYVSSPSLSSYEYSQNMSSLSSSYNRSYDRSGHERTVSLSSHYLNSPTDSSRTLTNEPLSKTSSVASLTRSHMELSPIFKSEAAKQIITEMSGEPTNGSLHRRQVPKEKRRHNTAPHHPSAQTLSEVPLDSYGRDRLARSLDDADLERALRGAPAPDVVRSALPPRAQRVAHNTIDQLLAAPQKILIPERYIPEKPPELSPEEQQKRQEKVESIKKMLSGSSTDPSQSPDAGEKRQREHLLQMNQILAKQVTEMSKIIAVKALEELPLNVNAEDEEDRSPDVELPIYQQRDNFFT